MRNHSFLAMFIWVTTRNSKHIRLFKPNTKQTTTTTTKPHKSPDRVGAIFLNEAWYKLSVNSRTEASTNSQPNQQNTALDVSQFISLINEFLNVSFPPYTANIFLLFSYAVLIGLSSALWGNSICERHVSLWRERRGRDSSERYEVDACQHTHTHETSVLIHIFI